METKADRNHHGVVEVFDGHIEIRNIGDLVKSGITVHPDFVAKRWGEPAAKQYIEAVAARVRSGLAARNTPAPVERRAGIGKFR